MKDYNTEKEVWKDVVGYEGYYQVSNLGRVKRLSRYITSKNGVTRYWRGRILAQTENPDGYMTVILSKEGKSTILGVHRVVAEAFIDNPENLPVTNHKDEDKKNNIPDNLEWCTVAYNNAYGTRTERMKNNEKFQQRHAEQRMPVLKLSLKGELLERFDSLEEAFNSKPEYSKSGINHCCTRRLNTYKGYFWIYEEDYSEKEIKTRIAKTKQTQSIKVAQFDLKGNLIKIHESMGKAAREVGINSGGIHYCCKGRSKTAGGYKWKYADGDPISRW